VAEEVTRLRAQVDRLLAQLRLSQSKARDEARALRLLERKLRNQRRAQQIAQQVAQQIQNAAHSHIADMVSQCLTVFDQPYAFRVRFVRLRGRTEARLTLERDGLIIDDPLHSSGGGVVDVAAFALRLSCLVLQRPAPRRLLVLDEPFRFVSRSYRTQLRDLLVTVARRLGVQVVLVTHDPLLEAEAVVRLDRPGLLDCTRAV
jgi:DNA repair exonuclease SbcCD ATPase subunit